MVDEAVLNSVRSYLRRLQEHGLPVSFGVILGSQVAGSADQWSDIDLLVVSPRFDEPSSRRDIDLLWRVAARVDSRIEPIACGEKQWEEDRASTIVEMARREGLRLAA